MQYNLRRNYQVIVFFFFNDTATTEIYTLSLHDALPISCTSKLIFARFPCQLLDSEDTPPRWHRPGVLSLACTAQIVTPSEYSTTSINKSRSSSLPLLMPSTRASSPATALA